MNMYTMADLSNEALVLAREAQGMTVVTIRQQKTWEKVFFDLPKLFTIKLIKLG